MVCTAFCLCAAGTAGAQRTLPVPPPIATIIPDSASPLRFSRERVLRLVAADSVPSLAVAVYGGGRLVWSEVVGYADRERGIHATTRTPYGLGSLSKSITGTAVMQLVDRGLIGLDQPLARYLGEPSVRELSGSQADLTVRHLLAMTGGVPHYVRNYWLDEQTEPPTSDQLIRDYGISITRPGTRYIYSNLAYGIAERLIEKVSGRSYSEHMERRVFAALGMTDARVRRDPADPAAAQPYHRADTALAYWFTDPEGAAGVQGSLQDLIRYAEYHLHSPLPVSPVVPGRADDPTFDYAFGWGVLNVGAGHRILISDGNVFGATSNLQIVPREDAFVILVTNSSAAVGVVEALATEIAGVVAPEAAGRREVLFASASWPPPAHREEPFRTAGGWAGRWEGHVHTPSARVPVVLQVSDSAEIRIALGDGSPVRARDVGRVGDRLEGWADSRLATAEISAYAHRLRFSLALVGERLTGTLTAWVANDPRSHFVLPFFVSLERPAA